jgi:hypothetical protein
MYALVSEALASPDILGEKRVTSALLFGVRERCGCFVNADPPAAEYSERTKVNIRPGSTLCYPLLHLFKLTYCQTYMQLRLYFCSAVAIQIFPRPPGSVKYNE